MSAVQNVNCAEMALEKMKSPELERNLKKKVITCAVGVHSFTTIKMIILQHKEKERNWG